jgi:ABC-type glutathione transport system ATPase component
MLELREVVKHYRVGDEEIVRAVDGVSLSVGAGEPTASLDTHRGREVLTLLAEVCHERDVGVLLVTHDPGAAAFADQVHALRDGRLVDHEPDLAYAPFGAR